MKDLMTWLNFNSGDYHTRGKSMSWATAYNYTFIRVKRDEKFDVLFC